MEEFKDLKIIYEDEWFLAIDKPSGLVVNKSDTYKGTTLQDILTEKYGFDLNAVDESTYPDNDDFEDDSGYESGFVERCGIVHRLDKDTSGVIVVSKKETTFKYLQKLFKKRKVNKEYYAVVFGDVKDQNIEINAPIARSPTNPFKNAVHTGGKEAVTLIEKVSAVKFNENDLSLLKISPKTGRTHQIRVHLTALNHSVVHDEIYNNKKQFEWSTMFFDRLLLHSKSLEFYHPVKKTDLRIETDLPEIFSSIFNLK